MSQNPFKAFFDVEVDVYEIITGNGYSNRGTKQRNKLQTVPADIQPYNGGLAEKEYGLSVECSYRMFTLKDTGITEGQYIDFAGNLYKVIYVEHWSYGDVLILKGEEA